jgi:hypothetical protein
MSIVCRRLSDLQLLVACVIVLFALIAIGARARAVALKAGDFEQGSPGFRLVREP